MGKSRISASMMCADLSNLTEVIKIFEEEGIDYLHVDVMDGEFVPNFGLGVDYIRGLRNLTNIPLDLHWMKPFNCKRFLAINPATPICMLEEVLDYIDGINLLMVNPGFAGQKIVESTLKKAENIQKFLKENNKENIVVEVDGNITTENAKKLKNFGASIFVAGTSSIFRNSINDYKDNIKKLRNAIE